MSAYQPKTGAKCGCRRGVQRDNCPHCEGTGMVIDFKAMRARGGEAMTHTATHTPGPWVVNVEGRMVEAQLSNLRNEYEHICDLRGGIKGQINLANAHLIAAAPDMLATLRAALAVCEAEAELRGENDTDDYQGGAAGPVAEMIRAAIAKAEGKEG